MLPEPGDLAPAANRGRVALALAEAHHQTGDPAQAHDYLRRAYDLIAAHDADLGGIRPAADALAARF